MKVGGAAITSAARSSYAPRRSGVDMVRAYLHWLFQGDSRARSHDLWGERGSFACSTRADPAARMRYPHPGEHAPSALVWCHALRVLLARLLLYTSSTFEEVVMKKKIVIVACLMGMLVSVGPAFAQDGQRGERTERGERGQRRGPPAEAVEACAQARSGDACSFTSPRGDVTGTCWAPDDDAPLACKPERGQRGERRGQR